MSKTKNTPENTNGPEVDTKSSSAVLPPRRNVTIGYGGTKYSIPTLALLAMLSAILAPTVMYSINLTNPTSAELLIAVCIALFSSILALWILDITAVLPFRAGWVSKSIWGTAIVSILGTSVGVYKNSFSMHAHPFEGKWEISIWRPMDGELVDRRELVLMYSSSAETYWGFSDAREISEQLIELDQSANDEKENAERKILWIEVVRLDIDGAILELRIHDQTTDDYVRIDELKIAPRRTRIDGSSGTGQTVGSYHIELTRPK